MNRSRSCEAGGWAGDGASSDKATSPDETGGGASSNETGDGASPDETGGDVSLDEAGDGASSDEFGGGASSDEAGGRARAIPLVPCPTPSPALPISNFTGGTSKHDLVFAMSLDS